MFSRLASDESTKHVTTYSLHPGDPFHNFAKSKSYLGQYLLLNYRYLLLNYRYLLLSYWKAVEMTNMAYHVWTLGAEFEPKECLLTVNNDYGSPSSVGRSLMAKVVYLVSPIGAGLWLRGREHFAGHHLRIVLFSVGPKTNHSCHLLKRRFQVPTVLEIVIRHE